ncbi:hypothetical protein [Cellvibrio sp. PSBB006]|uniref:hypothetical protein n=1 Tax=Cellvibrio sp. PSBB006 TaxID=1987723 RepID=UPI000B3B3F66|nr:hypothetical protein [Cellvibrio sp. PSBB006]ARU26576.1 hypothetical protein CBR65_03575 [Cellvibrio sp. PSBB006]
MDSYGTQFQLLSSAGDFRTGGFDNCVWDESVALFRLAVQQTPRVSVINRAGAFLQWQEAQPLVEDAFGQLGFLSEDRQQLWYALNWQHKQKFDAGDATATAGPVLATSQSTTGDTAAAISLDPVDAPTNTRFIDLHLGGDGRVALIYRGDTNRGLLLVHLARRWQLRLDLGLDLDQGLNLDAQRVWVDYLNRIWVIGNNSLGLCSGEPLPQAYQKRVDRFEPLQENPHPLKLHWQQNLPDDLTIIGVCADEQHLYLLLLNQITEKQVLITRSLDDDPGAPLSTWDLPDSPFFTDIAVLAPHKIVLMVPQENTPDPALDLPAMLLHDGGNFTLEPRRYPQHSQQSVRFVTGQRGMVRYLSEQGPKRLYPLAQARFKAEGSAILSQTLDSGNYDTVWHRIYMEACIPPGCELRVSVKAFDDFDQEGSDWQEQPGPLWLPLQSEIPFYRGRFEPDPHHEGLFEIQLQRQQGAVRQIRGRYLKLKIAMRGDGRHTPAIASMRVYCPRFSWQAHYLPEHFHQQESINITDTRAANGADVRERLLASFEGLMTPVEETIVNAECWLYPATTPERRLMRLGSTIGSTMPASWPTARKRRWLDVEGYLQQIKGTYAGLCLALDVATDGAVSRGQVIPVENYRLRRTLATIIGIDLDDNDHPLTLGTGQSGNSIVGESLILTDETSQEFLALFAPELAETSEQQEEVASFFDRYAYRLSIVLHGDAQPQRKMIEQFLVQQIPAHMEWKIIESDLPFVLGLSPLLGIDTYLQHAIPWREVILDDTWLGREGIMRNHAALSPADLLYGDRRFYGDHQ